MSNTKDYTITTIAHGLKQRDRSVFSQAGNNSISLRDKNAPYTVAVTKKCDEEEIIVKFPYGRISGST